MTINKSNYEIWFIDWIDGNLNDIQIEKLLLFLKENPDLEEEFAEITSCHLKPPLNTFPNKNLLRKSTKNITDSQFEYLCIASAENDLSKEQSDELKEIVNYDPEKRRIFELFQKSKLPRETIVYNRKNLLIRRTIGQQVLRIAFAGLSAAAVIIFAIIAFNLRTNKHSDYTEKTAQVVIKNDKVSSEKTQTSVEKVTPVIIQKKNKVSENLKKTDQVLPVQKDSVSIPPQRNPVIIEKIAFTPDAYIERNEIPGYLIASTNNAIVPEYDDGQSKFSRFIAKTFREKLLKEKTPKDTPLKGYEFAKAGISGLNLLLGWEMALDEKKDESGNLKSVYFSSKMLKFNAPVNKVETVR